VSVIAGALTVLGVHGNKCRSRDQGFP
jgi:hypothetical protein